MKHANDNVKEMIDFWLNSSLHRLYTYHAPCEH